MGTPGSVPKASQKIGIIFHKFSQISDTFYEIRFSLANDGRNLSENSKTRKDKINSILTYIKVGQWFSPGTLGFRSLG